MMVRTELEGLLAFGNAADKGTIDLEDVEWERVQMIERAVTGPEVVHEQRDAKPAKAAKNLKRRVHIRNETGLGHLQAQLPA